MDTTQVKLEAYTLTISGFADEIDYSNITHALFTSDTPDKLKFKYGQKTHSSYSCILDKNSLFWRFLSYRKGNRPDILDEQNFSIQQNPLKPTQTGVDWTHVFGGYKELNGEKRYILVIERNYTGLWATTLQQYIQRMYDKWIRGELQDVSKAPALIENESYVTVSVEPVPGEQFIRRIDELSRITEARIRFSRPNPGWGDLETELGNIASESQAGRVDLQVNASRNKSLSKANGIVKAIKDLFNEKRLRFAAVKGVRGKRKDEFSTKKLGEYTILSIEIDARGQLEHGDALAKMKEYFMKIG